MTWWEWVLVIAAAWFLFACVAGRFIGAVIHLGNPIDGIAAADFAAWDAETAPPEYEPDDEEAQRIAEQFAEAAAEEDRTHD